MYFSPIIKLKIKGLPTARIAIRSKKGCYYNSITILDKITKFVKKFVPAFGTVSI